MKHKKIFVRKIKKVDISFVIELLQSISDYKPSKKDYSKIWNKFNNQKNVHALVALINNKIVGYGSVVIETKIRGGKMGHIEDIVSHKKFRNIGIGKNIVNELFILAKKKGCYKMSLQSKKHNTSFYKKCGYKINGITMQRIA